MRLVLDGNISKTYVQALCMMFFPGERFPENEENPKGTISVKAIEGERGIECFCELIYDGKRENGHSFQPFSDFNSYKRTAKTAVGVAIYEAGAKLTEKDFPWGILTGIRPSKIGAELLESYSYEKSLEILTKKYMLSESKARLTLAVAKNETEILNKYDETTCSLYISIPFCPTRCEYCSFISYATKKLFDLIPSYLIKLKADIKEKLDIICELGLKLCCIYVGGGTPTTLNESQLDDLLGFVCKNVDTRKLDEFTVECGRPDTITKEKLEVLKKYGVGRISVNPQTLNDEVLKKIGRKHTVDEFFSAYKIVDDAKIEVVNTDLIVGLDGDNFESFKKTVDRIINLDPENITVHAFSIKKSAKALENDREIYKKENNFAQSSALYAYRTLLDNNYVPYYMYRQKNTVNNLENVGYAKMGTFGIYNVLMMSDEHTVFSAGAGATTKLYKKINGKSEIFRIFSQKYPYEYLQNDKESKNTIIEFYK